VATRRSSSGTSTIERTLPKDIDLQVSYVGTKGTHLLVQFTGDQRHQRRRSHPARPVAPDLHRHGVNPANVRVSNPFYVAPPGTPKIGSGNPSVAGQTITQGQLYRPYPAYPSVRLGYQRFGSSSYKRTQVSLRRAFRNNFEIGGHYTWSKSIDTTTDKSSSNGNDSATGNGNFTVRDLKLDRAVSRFDTPHRVVIFSVVDLPFGNGQRWLAGIPGVSQVVGGWKFSTYSQFQSGQPLRYRRGTGFGRLTWSATPCFPRSNRCYGPQTCALPDGDSVYVGVGRMLYFNPKAFRNRVVQYGPGAGANAGTYTGDIYYYGTTPRAFSNLRGWGVANTDISVTRTFRLTERASLLFRADAMNLFNRVSFGDGGIDKNFGSTYLPTTAAGVARAGESISSTFGTLSIRTAGMTSRYLQFSARINF